MSVQQERLYSTEEFEQILEQPENQERLLELIDGEITEKMPTEEHGELAALIAAGFYAPEPTGAGGSRNSPPDAAGSPEQPPAGCFVHFGQAPACE